MDVIAWIVLGQGTGWPDNMPVPGRSRQRSRRRAHQ
jgi:hypothetical protein